MESLYAILRAYLISVLIAFFLIAISRNLGGEFQYPLLRYPDHKSSFPFSLISAFIILAYFLLTGYLIFFGLSVPVFGEPPVSLSSLELAIAGMTVVGIIRVLTLASSIYTFQSLVDTLIIASAFSMFVAWMKPVEFTTAVNLATQNQQNLIHIIEIAGIGILLLTISDTVWRLYTILRKPLKASYPFIESIQRSITSDKIGYGRRQVREAYFKTVNDVISTEGVWEICWISTYGAESDFYNLLIDTVAARRAMDQHLITSVDKLSFLPRKQQGSLIEWAKKHLKNVGMFMIRNTEIERIQHFNDNMGFEPGKFDAEIHQHFMVINRRVIVDSWAAHNTNLTLGLTPNFRSSMFSISRNPSRIDSYLKLFEGIWGGYQMNRVGSILGGLSCNHLKLIDIIIDRSGSWSVEELVQVCKSRLKELSPVSDVCTLLPDLVNYDMIRVIGSDSYSRIHNIYKWQERWLEIHRNYLEL